jgi:hypothetical protein
VHSGEQHTGSEDSRFDFFNYSSKPLILKVCYITSRCCSCDNNPQIVLILEMYSLFSFRRYYCFGSSCSLVTERLTTKEDVYPSEGVT